MFALICVWINGWVNNREAGDLRSHRGHYDVIVMKPNNYEIDRLIKWPFLRTFKQAEPPTLYNGCNYLSMLGLKLYYVSKCGPRRYITDYTIHISLSLTSNGIKYLFAYSKWPTISRELSLHFKTNTTVIYISHLRSHVYTKHTLLHGRHLLAIIGVVTHICFNEFSRPWFM